MISCVSYSNLDVFGAAFASQFRLRHKCFIERQNYAVKTYDAMEYDQYDTPASVYLVYEDLQGNALGVSRLTPVSHCCMLTDLWPDMITDKSILEKGNIWEGTRFCIEKNLPASLRRKIAHELVLAYLEYGLANGIDSIIGLMPTLILRSVFKNAGVEYENLGPMKIIDGDKVKAAIMHINHEQLQKTRIKTGVYKNVLNLESQKSGYKNVA